LRNLLLFWWVCLGASLLKLSIFFPCSVCLMFNYNMHWRGSFLGFSVWGPKSLW
jgi:hypothetical protein